MSKHIFKSIFTVMLVIAAILSLSVVSFAANGEKEYLATTGDFKNLVPNSGKWEVDDDTLTLTQDSGEAGWCFCTFGSDDWSDYTVEFDIVEAIDGGILFRVGHNEEGKLTGYMLGSDGIYIYLSKYSKDGSYGTMSSPDQAVFLGKPFATRYSKMFDAHWKLVVEGNIFSVYIENELEPIIQATDNDYPTGGIGFNYSAPNLDGSASATLANIEVYTVKESAESETTAETVETTASETTAEENTGNVTTASGETTSASEKTTEDTTVSENVTDGDESSSSLPLIIGVCAAAAVIIAVVIILTVKKKK